MNVQSGAPVLIEPGAGQYQSSIWDWYPVGPSPAPTMNATPAVTPVLPDCYANTGADATPIPDQVPVSFSGRRTTTAIAAGNALNPVDSPPFSLSGGTYVLDWTPGRGCEVYVELRRTNAPDDANDTLLDAGIRKQGQFRPVLAGTSYYLHLASTCETWSVTLHR
jgi:hypothetical protein